MNIKLYQILEKEEMESFLNILGKNLEKARIIEIKEKDLFGDFIVTDGYKFKITNGVYQCLETPTEQHQKQTINIIKNKNDSINYKK